MTESRGTEAHTGRTLRPLTAKEIQPVDEVNHAVAVDGIVLYILPLGCTDGTADITLLVEDIIEL